MNFFFTLFTSVISSGALVAIVLWLGRTWISERLKQSIHHEYSQKLEALKASLIAINDTNLEKLKTASTALLDSRKLAQDRILRAIDSLWGGIVAIDENRPNVIQVLDIFPDNEYQRVFENEKFRQLIDKFSPQQMLAVVEVTKGIEKERIYIGEKLWLLFFVYRAINGRLVHLLINDRDNGTRIHWRQDAGIRHLLESVLDSKEIADIFSNKQSPLNTMFEFLRQKILHIASEILTGDRSANESIDSARRIAATLNTENRDDLELPN